MLASFFPSSRFSFDRGRSAFVYRLRDNNKAFAHVLLLALESCILLSIVI